MPDAGKFGLTYELLFDGDADWTDITASIDSRQTKITDAGCSTDLKSVISTCSIEMRYGNTPALAIHRAIVTRILTAKEENTVVRFRMGGVDSFIGKVDLGNFSQDNGRIPGFVTIDCEDNSYLLEEKMPTSFEYPTDDDLTDEGFAVFDKDNLAESIVILRLLDAGYTIDDVDVVSSDSITDKVRRIVYDADDERTYRDFLDILLFEYGAVLYAQPDGKLSVRNLYRASVTSERTVSQFLVRDKIKTKGGDYQKDGVKIKWSTLAVLQGAVLHNANITMEFDDDGNRIGEEIQPEAYWPENGDIEETWQEFDATFLDRPYQTNQSRLKNKDLALVSVKNAYYEVDKDAEVILANNPPDIEPLKARVLFYNSHATDAKKIYGFTIVGDALFRNKINDSTFPVDAKKLDEPYVTEFVFDLTVAERLANHLHKFRKHGDLQHSWSEIDVASPLFQIVTVQPPDSAISSLAMVISQTRTYPAPNKVKRENTAIGVSEFNSEPVRTRSIAPGGVPIKMGPAGKNGTKIVVEYALGTIDAPYEYGSTVVGTDLAIVGTSLAILGTDNSGVWAVDVPTPSVGEYVWRREGYYTPPALHPSEWYVTRITGNKGDAAVHGELSNDSHTVPTDVNGDGGNYTGCATTLHIYLGGMDDSANWTFAADVGAGITGSLTDNAYTVTDMSTDTGHVDITASKSGYSNVTRRFTISKSKQGAVGADATAYWLVSSVAAVKKTQAGAYVPASVSFTAKSQTGAGSPANYSGRFVISESEDGLDWTVKYTSEADEATKSHTPSSGIVALKCQLYQAGGTLVLLDEEAVPIVLDGMDGTDGSDGVNGADGTSILWKGEFASHPADPENGWAYRNTTDKKSYVYYGTWYQMTIDGTDGVDGDNGISIVWKGESATAPDNPEVNWVYKDTDNGLVYIYNGTAWEFMVQDGTDGADGASVDVEYSANGTDWHDSYTSGDIYLRQRIGEGDWSDAIQFVGDTAKGIALTASKGVINVTDRGTVYGIDILISAVLQNLSGTITWTVDSGTGTLLGSDNTFRTLDISTVETDEIVIKASIGGYSATYGFAKVHDGKPAPHNFGGVTTVPTETPDGEPLVKGDYFLWAATTTVDYTKGEIYEYNGTVWVLSTNGNLVMTMFDSIAGLANDVDSTVIGNAVIKKLVSIEAFIDNLKARMLEVIDIDGDYSVKVNKTDGIKQTHDSQDTFHAKPDGDVMMGNYNPSTKTGGIYYDKSEDKLLGNVAYDQWDLVIESDADLALLTTGTTTYENVLIAPGTYNFTATVDLNAHGVKRFVGCGIGQSILNVNYTPSSGNVIYAGSTLGEIGNFRLTTNKTQTGTAGTIMWIMIYGGTYTSVINVHDIKIDSMNGKGRGIITPSAGSMYYHSIHNVFVSDCYYGFMYCGKLVSCMAYNCHIGFHYCEFISLSYAVSCTTGWVNNTDIDYDSTNCDQQWTLGSQAINHGATYILPKGSYVFYRMDPHVSMVLQVYNGSTWYDTSTTTTLGTVVSDGTNMRIANNSDDTNATVYWRKKP